MSSKTALAQVAARESRAHALRARLQASVSGLGRGDSGRRLPSSLPGCGPPPGLGAGPVVAFISRRSWSEAAQSPDLSRARSTAWTVAGAGLRLKGGRRILPSSPKDSETAPSPARAQASTAAVHSSGWSNAPAPPRDAMTSSTELGDRALGGGGSTSASSRGAALGKRAAPPKPGLERRPRARPCSEKGGDRWSELRSANAAPAEGGTPRAVISAQSSDADEAGAGAREAAVSAAV
mmetsp:Transcript_9835/g.22526  ORF Transcript_9835/g.22526 Transcript_9835/m.22526 type:complete len:237 (-) Transcript_9835:249-959(-)